jgi:hypothetical protein
LIILFIVSFMSEFDYVSRLEALTTSLDDFWLIFSGFMVLLM